MTLYFDVDTRSFVTSPGYRDVVSTLTFKRGDNLALAVKFCRGTTIIELASGATGKIGFKPVNNFDGDLVGGALSWTKTGTGTATVYTFDLNLNTAELNALLGVGEAADVPSVLLNMEMEYIAATQVTSSNTILATIQNDVIRDEDETPTALPDASDWLSARAIRYDTPQSLTAPQKAQAITNIGAAPKFPPGVFEDNYAASLSGAVGKNEIYRQPSGVLAWLGLTADAAAYQDAHGISDARAVSLSAFFEGLADIGVAENFQDGGCFRRDTQPAAGAVARSLLGLGDLTLFAEPTKMRGGLYFDSTLSQYAYGSIPQTTGAREVVIFHSGLIANASTTQDVIARLRNGTTNTSLALASNGTSFGQATSFAGGSVRVTPSNPGWARNTTPFIASAVRDDGLAGVSSFSQYRWPTQAATFSRTSTQGEASHSLNNLILCADSNGTLTTFFRYIERIIPGWMLFDRILTDQETTDLNALISATLFPRWRMIWEGDSISNFIQQRASDKASFAGGNIHWINLALSGDATNNGIDQLGTSTGLNDTNLDGALPTVVEISYGQNDLGNYPARTVAEIHANLRTLWAYAKTRGAKVAARTVMQASSVYPTAREADRLILNDLIRADQGSHYDILVDLDQWCLDFTEIRPYYNDPQLFAPGDKVHPTLEAGKGANLMAAWISEVLDEAGAIP